MQIDTADERKRDVHMTSGADDAVTLRVTRNVPVWTVLAAMVVLVGSAVTLQLGQAVQTKEIAALNETVKEFDKKFSATVNTLGDRITVMERKDLEQDYRIRDIESRHSNIEGRLSSAERAATTALQGGPRR